MARTPGAPAVKEVKPTAAISWKSMGVGPVMRGGRPMPRSDAGEALPLDDAFTSPDRGWVEVDGVRVTELDERSRTLFRRERIGFVFQFFNLLPSLTARENVHLVTEIADDPMDPVEALTLVGLGERLDHFPSQLSGGEQQRVAIARAIAKRPDVLLCDEPTGSLDYETGKRILEVLDQVNRETGTLTVLVTHNAAIAALADRVLRMRDGRIVDEERNATRATPAEIRW